MARRNSTLGRSVLDLDIDDSAFHSKLSGAAIAAQKFTAQSGKDLMRAGKAITGVGNAMATNLTLPILGAGAAVTHFALDFDTTMRRIVGLAKVPKDAIAGVREEIMAMGQDVGRSPQELAEAFYFVASAGFEADEAMEVLRISATAAAAGMGETQDIAKTLGGVINAYGKENLSAAKAGDILTAAIQDGAAEASDFAGVIGFVVPVAASLGVSFDQVTAALSAMTQVGISADTAATNLGQVMASLQKPTKEAEKALEGLGLSSAGLRHQLREEGLLSTLRTLEERFAGNSEAAAIVFGNIRALRGVTALLGLDTEQLNGIFADTAGALGTLKGAYEDTEGPQREMDRNLAKLEASAIELGNDVLPLVVDVLGQIADGAEGLATWWKSLDKGTKDLIISSLAWLAVAGPILVVVGKLVTGLGALLRVVAFLSGAKGLGGFLKLLKTMRLLSFAALGPLGLLVGALVILYELLDGSDEAKQFESLAKKLGKSTKDLTKDLATAGVSAEEFAAAVVAAGGDVELAYERMVTGAYRFTADTAAALREGGGAIERSAKEVPESVAVALQEGEFVVSAAADDGIVDPIDEAMQKAVEDTGKRAQEMIDALAGKLADGPNQIKEELEALREALEHPYLDVRRRADLETALANEVVLKNLTSGDKQTEAAAAQQVENWLEQYELLAPGALAAGKLVNPALRRGIDANLAALLKWIETDAGVQVTDAFDFADVLQSMGYDSLAGYVRGIEMERLGEFTRELTTIQRDVHEKFDINLEHSGEEAVESYADGIERRRQAAIDAAAETQRRVAATLAFSAYWGGISVVSSWVDGMRYQLDAEYRQFVAKVGMYSDILGGSLPTAGPLQHPERGGASIGEWWTEHGLIRQIESGLPKLVATVGKVEDTLALMPWVATPTMPALGAIAPPSTAAASSSVADREGTGDTYIWQLSVNGVPYKFDTRDDFIAALDDLSAFGEGRLVR